MAYTSLKVLYYQNREKYETAYSERFNSEYAHHIDFEIAISFLSKIAKNYLFIEKIFFNKIAKIKF